MVLLSLLPLPLLLLAVLPGSPGTVRLGGVSLAWWYAGLVAPGVATLVTTALLLAFRE
jgi:hypothetical protein